MEDNKGIPGLDYTSLFFSPFLEIGNMTWTYNFKNSEQWAPSTTRRESPIHMAINDALQGLKSVSTLWQDRLWFLWNYSNRPFKKLLRKMVWFCSVD